MPTRLNLPLHVILLLSLMFVFQPSAAQDTTSLDPRGLLVGDTVSGFTLRDQDSSWVSLDSALKDGPVVLLFIRGQWCPYCNRYLGDLQDSLGLIEAAGARVIAISPERPDHLLRSRERSGAMFTLLYDTAYQVMTAFDLRFAPSGSTRFSYNTFMGAHLSEAHESEDVSLPVPATYVIDPEGVVLWRHFDPDYRNRAEIRDILRALPAKETP